MKIAIDVREFEKTRMTGIGRFLKNFILYAADIRKDWKFVLFGNEKTQVPFDLPKRAELILIKEFNKRIWEQILIPLKIKKLGCDLFFSPYYKVPFFAGVPSVSTVHDLTHIVYPEYAKKYRFYKIMARIYATRATKILTVSQNSKDDVIRLLKVNPDRISVVYNSIDFPFFNKRETSDNFNDFAKENDITKPYILYVGNSNPHKNVDALCKAYALLPDSFKNKYGLVLAGVGKYLMPGNIVLNSGNIAIISRVPEKQITSLYSNAALFVFPSLYEGFGFPPLEAMACGCPVVSSDAPAMPEILGDSCFYCKSYDEKQVALSIEKVLSDENLKRELIEKGAKRILRYSPEKVCEAIVNVFEELNARP